MGIVPEGPADFFVDGQRAMVSLGPVSRRQYCTYKCAFCYVRGDFGSYPSMTDEGIMSYLGERRSRFDIVYLSGDTDSFAPPRTQRAIRLLEKMAVLDCDLLFSTRAVLSDTDILRLKSLHECLLNQNHLLIPCVSISRLFTAGFLEPRPIPSPEARIDFLRRLHEAGLVTVVAVRPFLPVVPVTEYSEIVTRCSFVDAVLGEVWYADIEGQIESRVFRGSPVPHAVRFVYHEMDFDNNSSVWKVWEGESVRREVEQRANSLAIPFFMRSKPAVDTIRKKYRTSF